MTHLEMDGGNQKQYIDALETKKAPQIGFMYNHKRIS